MKIARQKQDKIRALYLDVRKKRMAFHKASDDLRVLMSVELGIEEPTTWVWETAAGNTELRFNEALIRDLNEALDRTQEMH